MHIEPASNQKIAAHPAIADPALRHDLVWLRLDGSAMTDADWNPPSTDCLVMALNGELGERDVDGHPLTGEITAKARTIDVKQILSEIGAGAA